MFTIKKTLLFTLLFLLAGQLSATHIVGGGMTYECLGNSGNGMLYRFTMKVYVDCFNGNIGFDDPANFAIYRGSNQFPFDDFQIELGSFQDININEPDCIDNLPFICLQEGIYVFDRVLPISNESYFVEYQRCCRTNAITNIINPAGAGATYYVEITPEAQQLCNSSPIFNNFPPVVICNNYPLEVDYSVTDPDGDLLVYSFCAPVSGGGQGGGGCFTPAPNPPCPPPFDEVVFAAPNYSPTEPMGGNPVVQINPVTGVISGTPLLVGQYVVGVCVEEYRNGQLLSVTRRDFQFNVTPCAPQVNALVDYDELAGPKQYIIKQCGSSTTVTIINESLPLANIQSFQWNFDLNGTPFQNNTDFNLTVSFPDFGVYNGTLVLNGGLDCGDTAFVRVELYPPASLDLGPDILVCKDSIIVLDAGSGFAAYQWQDGSSGQTFSATTTGLYQLAATDACGNVLADTVQITLSQIPDLQLPNVSLCPGESTTLNVPGFVLYNWSPAIGLSCTDCSTVTIQPAASTIYTVAAENQDGCATQGSFQVTVLPTPTITRVIQFYPNQPVTIGGQTYTQDTTFTISVPSVGGITCDSLNTYILELIPTTLELQCPADLTVALPNNATTVPVNYAQPTATTDCPGTPPTITLSQGLPSGGNFPPGLTTVCYDASNTCNNQDNCCFTVLVTSLELLCPANLTVALPNNATTAAVNYAQPTATTDCPGTPPTITLSQGFPSGGNFPPGLTTVCYDASNTCGNQDNCCFTVLVTSLDLQCPPNLTVALPNNATTAAVNYAQPTATTDCPGTPPTITLSQGLPSGGNFSSGLNTVCYTASNTCGNQDNCCFTVMVTTLNINCPANITVQLPVAATTMPVNYAAPTTTTNCPGALPTVNLLQGELSGGAFASGVNKVCYEGSNTCGNKDSCCFNITVLEPAAPCDIKNIGCMKYELLDIRLDSIKQPRFRIRVTNFCASEMDYAMIELPHGIIGVTPVNGSIYTAPNTGNQYLVRNPNASPFYSTRYRSVGTGIANGQSDVLEQRLPQQSFPNNYIHMNAKLKNGQSFEAYLNTFYCPVQPWAGSKLEGEGSDREYGVFEAIDLAIRPNPTDGLLYIDLSQWEGKSAQVQVLNAQGQLVLNRQYVAGSEWLELNLNGALANGLYYLMVQPEGGEKVATKFVLER